ncbi:Vps13c, partial [Symbiodinium pilosum]
VLGAMATRLPSTGPWFSWMGGPHVKETPQLGIWDSASLQFANPLHAHFILHLCGFSAKLALCRKLCQSGVLRNFSFQADVSSAEELSGPLWKASVDVLAAAKPCVLGWPAFQCPDGVFPSQDKGVSKLQVIDLPTPPSLSLSHLRKDWGRAQVTATPVDNVGKSCPAALWQMCDYVQGLPPPCHPFLGRLNPCQLWCCGWEPPEDVLHDILAREGLCGAGLCFYPPGVKIQAEHAGSPHLFFWVLKGEVRTGNAEVVETGQALLVPPGQRLICITTNSVVALCGYSSGHLRSKGGPDLPAGMRMPRLTTTPCPRVSADENLFSKALFGGWRWFGDPENWLGAPDGHEPVDQVAAAKQKALQAKPDAK